MWAVRTARMARTHDGTVLYKMTRRRRVMEQKNQLVRFELTSHSTFPIKFHVDFFISHLEVEFAPFLDIFLVVLDINEMHFFC